jgi:hypothetical protein
MGKASFSDPKSTKVMFVVDLSEEEAEGSA